MTSAGSASDSPSHGRVRPNKQNGRKLKTFIAVGIFLNPGSSRRAPAELGTKNRVSGIFHSVLVGSSCLSEVPSSSTIEVCERESDIQEDVAFSAHGAELEGRAALVNEHIDHYSIIPR